MNPLLYKWDIYQHQAFVHNVNTVATLSNEEEWNILSA